MMRFGNSSRQEVANFIYGRNSALSALSSGRVEKVYLEEGFSDQRILSAIKQCSLEPNYTSSKVLSNMVGGGVHQGIVVLAKKYEYSSIEEILRIAKGNERPIILLLDEINDPHNFGAILRSADAFGVSGIIVKNRNQVPLNMTVAKVSTGAIDHVKVAQANNLSQVLKTLKDNGFWVYAADGEGKDDYNSLEYDRPIALIVGSEGNGISRLVLDNSDFIIKIPMFGSVNSLNVSVATGILLSRMKNK